LSTKAEGERNYSLNTLSNVAEISAR